MTGPRFCFHFHGELNDFLPVSRREQDFEYVAGPTDTLKHIIESLGVPHTEIGQVTINGQPAPISEPPTQAGGIKVFPHLQPIRFATSRFVLDGHLGRLAAYLRMLGFDTWYDRYADDAQLAAVASSEQRILLTRDVGLLKRREVERGYCVRSHKPHDQLREITHRFGLQSQFAPFTRCMDCNAPLSPVPKAEIAEQLPPHTRETKNEFSRCTGCGKIFWRGSHYARMLNRIEQLNSGTDTMFPDLRAPAPASG